MSLSWVATKALSLAAAAMLASPYRAHTEWSALRGERQVMIAELVQKGPYEILERGPVDLTKPAYNGKPIAAVVFPVFDYPGEDAVFYGVGRWSSTRMFLDRLVRDYDVAIMAAENEDQVYDWLRSIPNKSLVVLAGHGTKKDLALSDANLATLTFDADERYMLDMGDSEFGRRTGSYTQDAVILLYSCKTGEGGPQDANMLSAIASWQPGVTVVAPSGNITSARVKKTRPFTVEYRTLPDSTVHAYQLRVDPVVVANK